MSEASDTDADVIRLLEKEVTRIGAEGAMELLGRSLADVVRAVPRVPSRVHVRFGCASIEVEWPQSGTRAEATPTASVPEPDQPASGLLEVRTPLVGTFYQAPEPGARPFVEVGDDVEAGQQVAIVEAMKLMNAILAEEPGRVVEVLVSDGESVEYGQSLLVLEPRSGE